MIAKNWVFTAFIPLTHCTSPQMLVRIGATIGGVLGKRDFCFMETGLLLFFFSGLEQPFRTGFSQPTLHVSTNFGTNRSYPWGCFRETGLLLFFFSGLEQPFRTGFSQLSFPSHAARLHKFWRESELPSGVFWGNGTFVIFFLGTGATFSYRIFTAFIPLPRCTSPPIWARIGATLRGVLGKRDLLLFFVLRTGATFSYRFFTVSSHIR